MLQRVALPVSYEVFYTPIPPGEKRPAKSLIDVGFDRVGEAISWWGDLAGAAAVAADAVCRDPRNGDGCSVVAIAVSTRLNRGYIKALEDSLLNRAVDFDLSDSADMTTRTTVLRTLRPTRPSVEIRARKLDVDEDPRPRTSQAGWAGLDPELQEIMDLRSRDRDKIRDVLERRRADGATRAVCGRVAGVGSRGGRRDGRAAKSGRGARGALIDA